MIDIIKNLKNLFALNTKDFNQEIADKVKTLKNLSDLNHIEDMIITENENNNYTFDVIDHINSSYDSSEYSSDTDSIGGKPKKTKQTKEKQRKQKKQKKQKKEKKKKEKEAEEEERQAREAAEDAEREERQARKAAEDAEREEKQRESEDQPVVEDKPVDEVQGPLMRLSKKKAKVLRAELEALHDELIAEINNPDSTPKKIEAIEKKRNNLIRQLNTRKYLVIY